jgi:asparagine synthase (glutamine-hydrolysing)
MPGIVGIISRSDKSDHSDELQMMIDRMQYEEFYRSGRFTDKEKGVYVGWINYENSFSDCNPIRIKNNNAVLIFSGENFIDKSLQDELKAHGYQFSAQNAEYIMALYELYGEDFFKELNGWYSGILVDANRDRIFLFNDRFGIERIYYYENDRAFWFASEAKSLLKILPALKRINPGALSQ